MDWRIAREVARIENHYPNPLTEQQVFELLDHFRYIVPAGSPMTGIGNDHQVASLSNCFVIGLDGDADSYGAVMLMDEEQVQLMKRRGGVGHDLSQLRPKGTPVNNSALTSTGVVPFMERFSNSTREVAQDGRRGALMLSISVKHPDSEAFIDAKMQEGKITGANVSVKLDDEFMQCAIDGKEYTQKFPIDSDAPIVTKKADAKKLWEKIVHNAWKSAEPGVLFWDTILRESIPDCYADLGFRTVSTNPCGEIPLCPYDSCRLLSVNLYSYVVNPFTPEAYFDFDLFKKHVALAQRIMDDIVDMEMEKIDKIIEKVKSDPQADVVKETECLLSYTSGFGAKRFGKSHFKNFIRPDFADFRLQWMLYCVWQKCKGNEDFRELLLQIPQEVVLVEKAMNQFDEVWIGKHCKTCKRREYCSDPII